MRWCRRLKIAAVVFSILSFGGVAHATVFGELQGIVHDPEHRPIAEAQITLRALDSQFSKTARANQDGYFSMLAVPLGNYRIFISSAGFRVLLVASRFAEESHGKLALCSLAPGVQKLFELTALTDLFEIYTSRPKAATA